MLATLLLLNLVHLTLLLFLSLGLHLGLRAWLVETVVIFLRVTTIVIIIFLAFGRRLDDSPSILHVNPVGCLSVVDYKISISTTIFTLLFMPIVVILL